MGADALRRAVAALIAAGVPEPERDAQILLAEALQAPRHKLRDLLADPLPMQAAARLDSFLSARMARQPVSQIIGRRAFWKHDFEVTRDTLDPRPDTETLIEAALEGPFQRVLDLGTGTGAILITLLAERSGTSGVGTDISDAALQVAQRNATRIGVDAVFRQADWFQGVDGQFDLIVSNPPYIALTEMEALDPEVRDWEPRGALTDGGDGLGAYRVIAESAGAHMTDGGRLLFEIGAGQGRAVCDILAQAGFQSVEIRQDLNGRDRVITAKWCR